MLNFVKNTRLTVKIMFALIGASAIASIFIGASAYYIASGKSKEAITDAILSPLQERARRLEALGDSIESDLRFVIGMRDVGSSVGQLSKALAGAEENSDLATIRKSIAEAGLSADDDLISAGGEGMSRFSTQHKLFHPTMRAFVKSQNYSDLYLVNSDGIVVYSVNKQSDFLAGLEGENVAETGLKRAYEQAKTLSAGEFVFEPFSRYEPSDNAVSGFIAMPIFAAARFGLPETFQGVLALRITEASLREAILAGDKNDPVQSYIVDQSGMLMTDVPLTSANDALLGMVEVSKEHTDGLSTYFGTGIRNEPSVISAKNANFLGQSMTVLSEETVSHANSSIVELRNGMLKSTIPAVLFIAGLAWVIGRSLAAPVEAINAAMETLKDGDLEAAVPGTERGDEIGSMARTTEQFRRKLSDAENTQQLQQAKDKADEEQRMHMLNELEQNVGAVVHAVVAGDFEKRVVVSFDDEILNNLGDGVNGICDVIRSFIAEVESTLEMFSNGDLTARMSGEFSGRFAEVRDHINETGDSLSELVNGIKKTGGEMTNSIVQVADGSVDLARRAEEQAVSLQETAATMDKISSTVQQNAKNALKAEALASETNERATKGQGVVKEAVLAMSEIESSSQKITDIISVIDAIAFQTNLLALNAAVEAARAGDAGKGFAVVASEVRTLAQRASEAAKDISSLINISSQKVTDGVELVNATGYSLNEISQSISEFSETISDISQASQEQSMGVTEISSSISRMDDMTQNNASLADSSASAAKSLTGYSDSLSKMIAVFRTNSKQVEKVQSPDVTIANEEALSTTNEQRDDNMWMDIEKATKERTHSIAKTGTDDWSDF